MKKALDKIVKIKLLPLANLGIFISINVEAFCILIIRFQPDRVDSLIVEDMTTNTLPEEVLVQISFISRVQKEALDSIPEGMTSKEEAAKNYINVLNKKFEEVNIYFALLNVVITNYFLLFVIICYY